MSAVASTNPGAADLSQWLSSTGSGIGSALSATTLQSALTSASPNDLVQLSRQTLQLQEASGLFGSSGAPATAATPQTLLLQALNSAAKESTTPESTAAPSSTAPSSTAAAATATATLALEQVSELFGSNSVSFLG